MNIGKYQNVALDVLSGTDTVFFTCTAIHDIVLTERFRAFRNAVNGDRMTEELYCTAFLNTTDELNGCCFVRYVLEDGGTEYSIAVYERLTTQELEELKTAFLIQTESELLHSMGYLIR